MPDHEVLITYVPRTDEHPGRQLGKIVQAAALDELAGLPVRAVTPVRSDTER